MAPGAVEHISHVSRTLRRWRLISRMRAMAPLREGADARAKGRGQVIHANVPAILHPIKHRLECSSLPRHHDTSALQNERLRGRGNLRERLSGLQDPGVAKRA